MQATSITKSRITRVLVLNQFIIAPTGSAKIIWESDRARFRPSGCSAGKMSAIIARTSIALLPRTRDGVSAGELKDFGAETDELVSLGLLRQSNGNFILTPKGKALTDSITEALL